MATNSAVPGDDPRQLLSAAGDLARTVRRQQRATWFPLLVFAALTFASIPVVRYSGHHLDCRPTPGGHVCQVYSQSEFVYWPIVLVLAYIVIAAFYIRRSRARGLGTRVRPYAVAGIVIAVLLTGVALVELHTGPGGENPPWLHNLPFRLASPGAAIGMALLVLAWAERNRALLWFTLAYLVVVLAPAALGVIRHPAWFALPAVFQGSMLLLGGLGFGIAQRPLRSAAP